MADETIYVLKRAVEKSDSWVFLESVIDRAQYDTREFKTVDDAVNAINKDMESAPMRTEYHIISILDSYKVEQEISRKLVPVEK